MFVAAAENLGLEASTSGREQLDPEALLAEKVQAALPATHALI